MCLCECVCVCVCVSVSMAALCRLCVWGCVWVCVWVCVLPTARAEGCNMTGLWRSGLGSAVHLAERGGGALRGRYMTAVEVQKGDAAPESDVMGVRNTGRNPTFSFSVAWAAGSTTSWVGQCFVQEDGQEVLKTMWLLRSSATSPQENWAAVRIGEDTFHRSPGNVVSEQLRAGA
uniref:Avidin-related protein 3 n=1 Tax=Callorhinchus milii TaxID=7868 RepID=V9LEJ9_CALMI